MKTYKAIWLKNHVINFMTYYTKVCHDIDHVIISQHGRQFELENMSIYDLDLTQSVHDKICIEMHQGSDSKFPKFVTACDKI